MEAPGQPLGNGLGSGSKAIAAGRQQMYVGGYFTEAGDKPSFFFAIYHDQMIDVNDKSTTIIRQYELYQNYPIRSIRPRPSNTYCEAFTR